MKLGILMSVLVVTTTAARIPKYRRLYVNPFNGQWNGWGSMGSGGAGQWPTNGGGDMTGTSDYGGGWMPSGGGDYGGMPGGDYGGGWNPGGGDYGGMPGGGGDYGGGWNPGGGDYGGMPGGGGGGGGWFPPMETTTTPEPTTTITPTCDSLKGSCVNSETECESKVIGSGQCEGSSLCCLPPVLPDVCGVTSVQKIVGGAESSAHAWPWQVSLQTSSDFHFCGGSLINNQWVVTAAHCVEESETYQIMLGEHDRNVDHGPEVKRTTIKVIKHEEYHGESPYPNDIALLKLNEPVEFNSQISPACVPEPGDIFTKDTECWISGWGDTKDTGDMTKLQEMRIDVVDNQLCGEKWGQGYIKDTNICVGNGNIGACNGDSGGPLSCKSDSNKWMLAGATSWGISGCQTEGYPNVYTRVSEYRKWIIERILAN